MGAGADAHGSEMPLPPTIRGTMLTRAIVLVVLGLACLAVSAWLLYHMLPRENRPAPRWMQGEGGETTAALSQFILMILGISLVLKGVL